MEIIEVGAAAPGGYVRAVFSRKAGGFAAPLDLMRAQIGAAGKLARRRRLRAAFADYLVSDGLAKPFSEARWKYAPVNDDICITGGVSVSDWRFEAAAGGPVDAPDCVPVGGCESVWPYWCAGDPAPQMVARREPVRIDRAFSERMEHWRGFVERMPRYWGTGALVERSEAAWMLRDGFEAGALDAPVFVPGGGALWREGGGGFVGSVVVMREGW